MALLYWNPSKPGLIYSSHSVKHPLKEGIYIQDAKYSLHGEFQGATYLSDYVAQLQPTPPRVV